MKKKELIAKFEKDFKRLTISEMEAVIGGYPRFDKGPGKVQEAETEGGDTWRIAEKNYSTN